jgi:tubulin polyglutamylase TTLL6/13
MNIDGNVLVRSLMTPESMLYEVPFGDMAKAVIIWSEQSFQKTKLTSSSSLYDQLLPYQKLSHFPLMCRIVTKSSLGKILKQQRKMFPNDYQFLPDTWELPQERISCEKSVRSNKSKTTYILKPTKGLQGTGIILTNRWDVIRKTMQDYSGVVVQRYIHNPMLVDNTKWDMRIYVLVSSLNPIRAYLFKDGLARFATEPYVAPCAANFNQSFVHLTNYSLNRHHPAFRRCEDDGEFPGIETQSSKRPITTTLKQLQQRGISIDVEKFWKDVGSLVVTLKY